MNTIVDLHTLYSHILFINFPFSSNLPAVYSFSPLIPNFGVSTAILNTIYISLGGASWTLDLCEARLKNAISLKNRGEGTIFLLSIIDRKRLGRSFWIMICIYYYSLNRISLDLDLVNSYWIRKIPNFATKNIWFFTHHT